MDTTVDRKELLRAVQVASKGVTSRATLPALQGLRLTANGRLEVAGTDLETTFEAAAPADVVVYGCAVVPAKMFAAALKASSAETVRLVSTEGELEVNGARLKATPADAFPALPTDGYVGDMVRIHAPKFVADLRRVIAAASADESRQVLTGVQFGREGEALVMAATDSYRLAVVDTGIAWPFPEPFIVPAKALAKLLKIIGKKAEHVAISHEEGSNLVVFQVDARGPRVGVRLIEGQFPNWRQLVPEGGANVLTFERAAILAALAAVEPYAQQNLPVKLELTAQGSSISAHTPDIGEAEAPLEGTYTGEALVIAFNPAFMRTALESCEERGRLEITSNLKPARIDSEGAYFSLLMPVRLS